MKYFWEERVGCRYLSVRTREAEGLRGKGGAAGAGSPLATAVGRVKVRRNSAGLLQTYSQ